MYYQRLIKYIVVLFLFLVKNEEKEITHQENKNRYFFYLETYIDS